jgi:hypothetical protein
MYFHIWHKALFHWFYRRNPCNRSSLPLIFNGDIYTLDLSAKGWI